jgi:DNA-binding NarL/FixJ family response regulator
MSTRILLVDDHRMFREGLRLMIARELPDASVVGEADDAAAALESARTLRPELIVMDIHLPDGNGIEVSRQILAEMKDVRVIVLSAETNMAFVREALRAGVSGYLLKSSAPEELPQAIHAVLEGRLYLCQEASRVALEDYRETLTTADAPRRPALSGRELQVLRLISEGLRTKEIADKLNVGIKTAETYRRRLSAKLGCNGTAELVHYAIREGLVPP